MELINILYLQDIDLGVGREAFDDLCNNTTAVRPVEQKGLESTQTLLTEDDKCHSYDASASVTAVPSTSSEDNPQYIKDTETGEWVMASASVVRDTVNMQSSQQSDCELSTAAAASTGRRGGFEDMLTHNSDTDLPLVNNSHTDDHQSYEERWEDMLSILDVQSVLEGDTYVDTEWDSFNQSSSLALMRNVSMTQPVASSSAADVFTHNYMPLPAMAPLNSDPVSFLESLSISTGVNQSLYDAFDSCLRGDLNCSSALSSTMEQYSAASAALNNDMTELSSVSNDTNALFQQLLCTNLLLDELNNNSSNMNMYNNWSSSSSSSADSAVSSMHSPTFEISDVDCASGFTGDVASTQLVTAAAAAGSTSDRYSSREFACGRRTVSASNISVSNSSDDDIHRCSSDDMKAVKHNHTYPLTTTPRSPHEQDDDRDTRCRDEKKATDMQIPLTMEEMIDSTVEQFTELLSRHTLSEAQSQLVRDIRRRGKNKLAAQNCRKRKLEVIQTVEDELLELRRDRDKLLLEKSSLNKCCVSLKQKLSSLEAELFRRVCNETGQEYDPRLFSLVQTDDGRLFIVSRGDTSASHSQLNKRKRKPEDKD